MAPRTQKNYLNHLTTFLRGTGRVVMVARNEQEAALRKATAIIRNTLILRPDFPRVNKKDYNARSVVDAMFAAGKNLRELVMVVLFYSTGCPEAQVARFRWTDVRWESKELFFREWWPDDSRTKTHEDRIVDRPDQLIEILKKALDILSNPAHCGKEGWLSRLISLSTFSFDHIN